MKNPKKYAMDCKAFELQNKAIKTVYPPPIGVELWLRLGLKQWNFEFLFEEFRLPMTLKIHVIIDHYSDYFQWTNQTMRLTNAEFTETAHSTFKMSERIHKFKISRKIGTPVHQEMALKSLVWHNSKRAGFVSPQDFRLRKSSPRVWGSPLSSPRLKLN